MKDAEFRGFLARERLKLINYVRSLVKDTAEMDAEDVVHDVLVKMLEKRDPLVPLDNLAAYVYRALKNRVIDAVRTRKHTLSLEGDSEEGGKLIDLLHDVSPNSLEILQTREGRTELFEALETLSEMERQVVIAHEFEGMSFKAMSQAWHVPQNTLLSHKSRAMKKLKRRFVNA